MANSSWMVTLKKPIRPSRRVGRFRKQHHGMLQNRIERGEPWFRMKTVPGRVNARSAIHLVEVKGATARFVLPAANRQDPSIAAPHEQPRVRDTERQILSRVAGGRRGRLPRPAPACRPKAALQGPYQRQDQGVSHPNARCYGDAGSGCM